MNPGEGSTQIMVIGRAALMGAVIGAGTGAILGWLSGGSPIKGALWGAGIYAALQGGMAAFAISRANQSAAP